MLNKETKGLLVVGMVLVLSILFRFIPHFPNFAPITALALFSGYSLGKSRLSILIPIVVVFLSDLLLHLVSSGVWGFYPDMVFTYGAYMLISLIGVGLTKIKNRNVLVTAVGGGVLASITFFLVSNFGVWAVTNMYPKNGIGLLACYEAGLLFYRQNFTIVSDLLFSIIMFGLATYVFKLNVKSEKALA
ncbi:MAG: DUF6580 family putative transport protein [Bacteroidota bacterium]|nr:DUF6580 family putative transport protein [Bacteroidota bacterium]